ncbi:MAG: condensation domain-containing protein, partial [Cyanobacteria bacterium J06635_15]
MPLRAIFESPTIVQLGQTVSQLRTTNQASTRPPIRPRTDHGKLPLSFAQQRLWFLDQLDSDSLAYSVPAAVSLVGLLNIAILKQVFNEIVRRHEILRTTFSTVEGQPIQLISPSLNISLPVVNLGDLPEVEQKGEVQRLIHQWCQKPFDLTQGPLLRVMLLQLKGAEHLLLFNLHHIASDGWSMGVLVKEIAVLYEVFSQGQPSPLPELPIQYADFAVWQRQWLQGEVLETQLAYWKQRLGANPSVLELPTDQPPSSSPTSHGTKHLFSLSQRLTEKIKALSKQEGVTLFMTLLGAFKALLHSYKDQEDILVGMPITNRSHAEIEGLVGLFLNTLVLRTDLSGNPTFREILRRVREVTLGAYTHQDLPFEKLVGELKLERDLNSYPLFRVWFVFNNALTHAIELPGLTLDQLEVETGTVRHDLKLELTETAEGLKGFFEYKTDLFEASTIALMVELFELIIDKVVQNSTLQLSELGATLKEAQQQQQLSKEKEFQEARRKKLSKLGRRAIRGSTARVLK